MTDYSLHDATVPQHGALSATTSSTITPPNTSPISQATSNSLSWTYTGNAYLGRELPIAIDDIQCSTSANGCTGCLSKPAPNSTTANDQTVCSFERCCTFTTQHNCGTYENVVIITNLVNSDLDFSLSDDNVLLARPAVTSTSDPANLSNPWYSVCSSTGLSDTTAKKICSLKLGYPNPSFVFTDTLPDANVTGTPPRFDYLDCKSGTGGTFTQYCRYKDSGPNVTAEFAACSSASVLGLWCDGVDLIGLLNYNRQLTLQPSIVSLNNYYRRDYLASTGLNSVTNNALCRLALPFDSRYCSVSQFSTQYSCYFQNMVCNANAQEFERGCNYTYDLGLPYSQSLAYPVTLLYTEKAFNLVVDNVTQTVFVWSNVTSNNRRRIRQTPNENSNNNGGGGDVYSVSSICSSGTSVNRNLEEYQKLCEWSGNTVVNLSRSLFWVRNVHFPTLSSDDRFNRLDVSGYFSSFGTSSQSGVAGTSFATSRWEYAPMELFSTSFYYCGMYLLAGTCTGRGLKVIGSTATSSNTSELGTRDNYHQIFVTDATHAASWSVIFPLRNPTDTAVAICRMIGYTSANASTVSVISKRSLYRCCTYSSAYSEVIESLDCPANATRLSDCDFKVKHNFADGFIGYQYSVDISCGGTASSSPTIPVVPRDDWQWKLLPLNKSKHSRVGSISYYQDTIPFVTPDGTSNSSGILLVRQPGTESDWMSVNYYGVDFGGMQFACRKLGFNTNRSRAQFQRVSYTANVPVGMGVLRCPAGASALEQCNYVAGAIGSWHIEAVELECNASVVSYEFKVDPVTQIVLVRPDARERQRISNESFALNVLGNIGTTEWFVLSVYAASTATHDDIARAVTRAALNITTPPQQDNKVYFGWQRGAVYGFNDASTTLYGVLQIECASGAAVVTSDCIIGVQSSTTRYYSFAVSTRLTDANDVPWLISTASTASTFPYLTPLGTAGYNYFGAGLDNSAVAMICRAAGFESTSSASWSKSEVCTSITDGYTNIAYVDNVRDCKLDARKLSDCKYNIVHNRSSRCYSSVYCGSFSQLATWQFELRGSDAMLFALPPGSDTWGPVSTYSSTYYAQEVAAVVCIALGYTTALSASISLEPNVTNPWPVLCNLYCYMGAAEHSSFYQACYGTDRQCFSDSYQYVSNVRCSGPTSTTMASTTRAPTTLATITPAPPLTTFASTTTTTTLAPGSTWAPTTSAPPTAATTFSGTTPQPTPSTTTAAATSTTIRSSVPIISAAPRPSTTSTTAPPDPISTQQPPPTTTTTSNDNNSALGAAGPSSSETSFERAGIPLISVAIVLLVIALIVLFLRNRKKKPTRQQEEEELSAKMMSDAVAAGTASAIAAGVMSSGRANFDNNDNSGQGNGLVPSQSIPGTHAFFEIDRVLSQSEANQARPTPASIRRAEAASITSASTDWEQQRAARALLEAAAPMQSMNPAASTTSASASSPSSFDQNAVLQAVAAALAQQAAAAGGGTAAAASARAQTAAPPVVLEERTARVSMPLSDLARPTASTAANRSGASLPKPLTDSAEGMLSLDDL